MFDTNKFSSSPFVIHSKHAYEEMATIFDFIPFGIALFDEIPALVYYNQTLRDLFGATFLDNLSEIIMGLSSTNSASSRNSQSTHSKFHNVNELIASLKNEGDVQACEFNHLTQVIRVKAKILPLGEGTKYVVTFSNVTKERQYEVLKEISSIKSKIISSISHEIRNPLHNIMDSLANCQKESTSTSQNIDIAMSNANHILYKIDDLLVSK